MLATRFDLAPWHFEREADEAARVAQQRLQAALAADGVMSFGERCYVSPLAGLDPERFSFGAACLISAWAILAGEITAGQFCTFNSHAVLRGRIRLGNAVRIASHASLIGFEHVADDIARPIFTQGIRRQGIDIGDDVWIGAGAQILDGVQVGSHAIVGAGAVVTADVPAYAVVVGNPARVIRDRRQPRPARPARPGAVLRALGANVERQWRSILQAHRLPDGQFTDTPGDRPSLRARCDAIELAAMFGASPAADHAATLLATQDAGSGLPLDSSRDGAAAVTLPLGDFNTAYHVLCVGYALECVGARYARPFAAVAAMGASDITGWLERLPWREQPWNAGAWVDSLASAMYFNAAHGHDGGGERPLACAVLFEWLNAHCLPHTGLWSGGQRAQGWLQPVNGFYRVTRGTYAQFGLRVPYPESTIDTVLAHARLFGDFAARGATACNVLDALHALWLCGRATTHRADEARRFAATQIALISARWQPDAGFAFAPGQVASLRGTEMWLAALYTAAALLGAEDEAGYSPRGIHRLGAAGLGRPQGGMPA